MAKLVKIVKGGYNIVGTDEVIPAVNLMPFGILHHNNIFIESNVKIKSISAAISDSDENLNNSAERYATGMKADFYELDIDHNVHPIVKIFGNPKECSVVSKAKIQLYIKNSLNG